MPRVDPSLYDKDYYLEHCSGFKEFQDNSGEKMNVRFKEILKFSPKVKQLKILDVGCGRGELCFWLAKEQANEVVGIDYSKEAIKIARLALSKKNSYQKVIKFLEMDAKKLKFPDEYFDGVFLIEVWEHLYSKEIDNVLKEISRVLKKNGFLFVHTAPSRFFNDYAYKYWCYPVSSLLVGFSNLLSGNHYPNLLPPNQIRDELSRKLHVNEPIFFNLKEKLEKFGFEGRIFSTNVTVMKPKISWKDSFYNSVVFLNPLSRHFPFNVVWGNDYLGVFRKK